MIKKVMLFVASTALGLLGLLGSTALAAPVWNLDVHHNQTHFTPGGTGQYWFEVQNVGNEDSSGPIVLTLNLPSGMTRDQVLQMGSDQANIQWNCPGSPGDKTVVCTTNGSIARHVDGGRRLEVNVTVAPGAAGEPFASAKVEGGGAAKAATAVEPTPISAQEADFGIFPASFRPDFFQADGVTPERRAGGHPDLFVTPLDFNSISDPDLTLGHPFQKAPAGNVHNLVVDLPPGFVGAPTAVGECNAALFTSGQCPRSSQVGRIETTITPITNGNTRSSFSAAVYNFSHPRGYAADLGFGVAGNPVHVRVSLDPSNRYGIRSEVLSINESQPVFDSRLTLWGTPADSSHDSERCGLETAGSTAGECPTDATPKPFLTVPAQCAADNAMRLHEYDSWQHRGQFGPDIVYTLPGRMTDCDKTRFEPQVEVEPTGTEANAPTGLDVSIRVPLNDNPNALETPPVKYTRVTLPEGMTFNPAFADGLDGCSLAEFGIDADRVPNGAPVACPDNSRIGDVSLTTPLLPDPVVGSMYLAKPLENACGNSNFALYMALHDTEERGVLLKIPGCIELDERTGQITTTFDDLPQFPFEEFSLGFRSGERAPLVTPPTCGNLSIGVEVASYAQPDELVDASDSFAINRGPGGGPCPSGLDRRPFAPRMAAGTLNPVAGAYSPFIFRLNRGDDEQEISRVTSVLPPGLLAKLAGISDCPDAAIAAIPTALGGGRQELASPSCPASSQVGTLSAGVGSGSSPNYFPGSVYLAGPYKGAALSLVAVSPAIAGPYDFGNVVVRIPVSVNPDTSRVKATSDEFPSILHGVLLRIRDIRLRVDRPETMLNPTSCDPFSVDGLIGGVGGDLFSSADDSLATATTRFQVADCGGLDFRPQIAFKLKGGTHRGDYPAIFSTVRGRAGDANIGRAVVALPHALFLANEHIGTVCTRVQFRQGIVEGEKCPANSVIGSAKAITPLLDQPVEGPVVLRSSDNPLPDLVAVLRGRISANLVGRIDGVNGGIRTTFASVPDVPVKEFSLSLLGGKKGLLVNSTNLCKRARRADVHFTAQSNARLHVRPLLQDRCKKSGKRRAHKRPHRRG